MPCLFGPCGWRSKVLEPSKTPKAWGLLLGLLAAALAIYLWWLPLKSLFLGGIFSWSVAQDATWQGAIEVVALCLALFALLLPARKPWHGFWAVLPLLFYLRRHGIDLAAAGGVLYVEILILFGSVLWRGSLDSRDPGESPPQTSAAPALETYLSWFLAGVSLWATMLVIASLGHLAYPWTLRLLLVLLGLVAALARVRQHSPLTFHLTRRVLTGGVFGKAVAAFVASFAAALLARSNLLPDHDSLWYGLRGEYVLAPGGSIFDSLGLIGGVYYYPKLFEALLLPLSGLGDFSLVIGLNICSLLLFGLAVFCIGRRAGLSPESAVLTALLCLTLPAAASISVGAKPDLFAALLLSLATLFFWRLLSERSWADGAMGLAAIGMALVTKVTSIPYGGLLLVGTLLLWLWRQWQGPGYRLDPGGVPVPPRFAVVTFTAAWVVHLAFILRTVLLAGVPSFVGMGLWRTLGMELKYPVGVVPRDRSGDLAEIPNIVRDFLVDPNSLPQVRITWTGNGWLFFAVVGLAFSGLHLWRNRKLEGSREGEARNSSEGALGNASPWLPVIAAGVFFALLYNNAKPGGDGNYYIFPVGLATILAVRVAASKARPWLPILMVVGAAFALQQAAISFVACRWEPGTRSWDLSYSRTPFDTRDQRREILQDHGLGKIAAFLDDHPGVERVVGYGPHSTLHWLPARYESIPVADNFEPNPFHDPARFLRYLLDQEIDFAILPRLERDETAAWVLEYLARQPEAVVLVDGNYRLIDLRPLRPRLLELAEIIPQQPVFWIHEKLLQRIDEAEIKGQAPLPGANGNKVGETSRESLAWTGRYSLRMVADSSFSVVLELPDREGLMFRSQVGYYPPLVMRNLADGAVATVSVEAAGTGVGISRTAEVGLHEAFVPIELPLDQMAGQKVRITLEVGNRKDHHRRHDWLLWVSPEVVSSPVVHPKQG